MRGLCCLELFQRELQLLDLLVEGFGAAAKTGASQARKDQPLELFDVVGQLIGSSHGARL
jgi:hypothetical protein